MSSVSRLLPAACRLPIAYNAGHDGMLMRAADVQRLRGADERDGAAIDTGARGARCTVATAGRGSHDLQLGRRQYERENNGDGFPGSPDADALGKGEWC